MLLEAAAGGQCPLVGEKHLWIFHGQHQGVPSLGEIGVFRNFFQDGYAHKFSGFRAEGPKTGVKDAAFSLKTQQKYDAILPRRAGGAREAHSGELRIREGSYRTSHGFEEAQMD